MRSSNTVMNRIVDEIQKLRYTHSREISENGGWQETVNRVKSVIETKADPSLVSADPQKFSLESEKLPQNRFFTDIHSAHFECFLKKGDLDYLVVFFLVQDPAQAENLRLILRFPAGHGIRI